MRRRTVAALMVALTLALGAGHLPARADSDWLDGPQPPPTWNFEWMPIPAAPAAFDLDNNQRCSAFSTRPAETAEDAALVEAGWLLGGAYHAGWGTKIILGLSSFDGMCRYYGYNFFVFQDGIFAGTLSPQPMASRTDGAADEALLLGRQQVRVTYRRYSATDPLCCPSGRSTVMFSITNEAGAPVVWPGTVTTQQTAP